MCKGPAARETQGSQNHLSVVCVAGAHRKAVESRVRARKVSQASLVSNTHLANTDEHPVFGSEWSVDIKQMAGTEKYLDM